MNKQKIKRIIKQNGGITLVALVVTIVVLIILATISMSVILDENGIIKKSQQAKNTYQSSESTEKQMLDNITKKIEWMNSKVVSGKTDADGNVIPIPKGCYYVTGTKNTGVVISDNQADENNPDSVEGNQYVWIPVDNINDYQLTSWNGEMVAEEGAEGYYQNYKSTTTTGGHNPGSFGYIDDGRVSIEAYGGFYIGRYEVSFDEANNKIETKKNKTPYTNQDIDTMKMYITEYSDLLNNTEQKEEIPIGPRMVRPNPLAFGPKMVMGKQWDAMIRWLNQTNSSEYNTIGHTGASSIRTGSDEAYKINNIYDIAGNVSEYVHGEFYGSTMAPVYRGGNYKLSNLSANMRTSNDGSADEAIGTRVVIILPVENTIRDTDDETEMEM